MKTPNYIDALFILISCLIFVILNFFGALEELSKFSYLIIVMGYYLGKAVIYYRTKTKVKVKN